MRTRDKLEGKHMNVLVLGNGFDLHHKMKTKYSDFIDYINYLIDNKADSDVVNLPKEFGENNFLNYFIAYDDQVGGWIDFEILVRDITKEIENSLKMFKGKIALLIIELNENQKLLYKAFDKIYNNFDDRYEISSEFKNKITGINKKTLINVLRKEFEEFCKCIYFYLMNYEPGCRDNQDINSTMIYQQIKNINADAVITFNYTDTYIRYGIDSDKVVHVHGSLKDKNIVLGFNDDNEDELDFVYFKKYMQCILKHTPIIEDYDFTQEIVDRYGDTTFERSKPQIHIFGHSLDETDRETLLYIFNCANNIIVYYRDEDDMEEKIEKIIKLLGKKEALKKIYDKTIDFELIRHDLEG